MKKNLVSLSLIISMSVANANDMHKIQECAGVWLALATVTIPVAILDYCIGYKDHKKVIEYLEPYVRDIKQGKNSGRALQEAAEDARIVKRLPYYLAHHTHEYIPAAQQWSLSNRVEYLNSLLPEALNRLEVRNQSSFFKKLLSYLSF